MKKEDVECPYKDRCTEYPKRCDNCDNNSGKRSYFKQKTYYIPPINPYPWPSPLKPTWKQDYWISTSDRTDGGIPGTYYIRAKKKLQS